LRQRRPKKTIREAVRKDLEVNELDPNMVFEGLELLTFLSPRLTLKLLQLHNEIYDSFFPLN